MSNFGIAHLSVGQTDPFALGMDQGVRPCGQQLTPVGDICQRDGVVGGFLAVTPAIKDQQYDRFLAHYAVQSEIYMNGRKSV